MGREDAEQVFGTSPVRSETNQNPKLFTWTVNPDAIIDNVGRGKQELEYPLGQADEFRGSRAHSAKSAKSGKIGIEYKYRRFNARTASWTSVVKLPAVSG